MWNDNQRKNHFKSLANPFSNKPFPENLPKKKARSVEDLHSSKNSSAGNYSQRSLPKPPSNAGDQTAQKKKEKLACESKVLNQTVLYVVSVFK